MLGILLPPRDKSSQQGVRTFFLAESKEALYFFIDECKEALYFFIAGNLILTLYLDRKILEHCIATEELRSIARNVIFLRTT